MHWHAEYNVRVGEGFFADVKRMLLRMSNGPSSSSAGSPNLAHAMQATI
jgi:hypothetical protein